MQKKLLKWREKQRKGAIMKPSTFEDIKKSAMKSGMSEERANKIAGAAYWTTAKAKYKERRKK